MADEQEQVKQQGVRFADQVENGAETDPLISDEDPGRDPGVQVTFDIGEAEPAPHKSTAPKLLDKRIEELRLEGPRKRSSSQPVEGARKRSASGGSGSRKRSGSGYSETSELSEWSETGMLLLLPWLHGAPSVCQKLIACCMLFNTHFNTC